MLDGRRGLRATARVWISSAAGSMQASGVALTRLLGPALALAGAVLVGLGCQEAIGPCGTCSGPMVTESRPVGDFDTIAIDLPAEVIIDCACCAPSLTICAQEDLLEQIHSRVHDGRLCLHLSEHTSIPSGNSIVIRARTQCVREIEASGTVHVELRDVDGEDLTVYLSGICGIHGTGSVGDLALRLSGVSNADMGSLRARRVAATVSGVSYGLVRASDQLSANVSGVSVLEYLGNPRVTQCVSGSSSLRRLGP